MRRCFLWKSILGLVQTTQGYRHVESTPYSCRTRNPSYLLIKAIYVRYPFSLRLVCFVHSSYQSFLHLLVDSHFREAFRIPIVGHSLRDSLELSFDPFLEVERWKQNYFCCPVSGQNKVSVLLQNVNGCVLKNPVGSEKVVAEKFLFTACTCPGGKGHRATCVHLSGASL